MADDTELWLLNDASKSISNKVKPNKNKDQNEHYIIPKLRWVKVYTNM